MSNLLPAQGKKIIRREYWLRALSVWLFLISGAVGAVGIFFMPALLIVSSERQTVIENIQKEDANDRVAYTEAQKKIERANAIVRDIRAGKEIVLPSKIVREVRGEVSSGITLVGISYEKGAGAEIKLSVRGIAKTRQSLATFVDALKENANFAGATVPISDLALDADLPFVATVTLENPKK